jgi:hypothetical protein
MLIWICKPVSENRLVLNPDTVYQKWAGFNSNTKSKTKRSVLPLPGTYQRILLQVFNKTASTLYVQRTKNKYTE